MIELHHQYLASLHSPLDPFKGIKFQSPGLFLVVFCGTNFTPSWRTQVYIMWHAICFRFNSGDNFMYPYQHTPMGNHEKTPYIVGIYGFFHPQESHPRTPAEFHGYTYVRGTPLLYPLKLSMDGVQHASWHPLKDCMMVGSPYPQGWVGSVTSYVWHTWDILLEVRING